MTASPIFCSSDFLAYKKKKIKKIRKTLSNTGCLSLSSWVSGLVTFSLQQSNVRAIVEEDTVSIQSRIWKCTALLGFVMGFGMTTQ